MSKWLDISLSCTQLSFKVQSPSNSPMNSIIDVENHKLFLGNINAANDPNYLKQHNIGAVLSVIDTSDLRLEKCIIHHWIAAADCEKFELIQYFDQAANFIRDNLKHTNVLVHCYAGISRSSSLVIAYLMKYQGLTLKDALQKTKNQRPQVEPNSGFLEQLKKYETKLKSHNHISYSAGNNMSKYIKQETQTNQSIKPISNFNIYSNLYSSGTKTHIKNVQLTSINSSTYTSKPSFLDKSKSPTSSLSRSNSKGKTFFDDPVKQYQKLKTVEQMWQTPILGLKNIYGSIRRSSSRQKSY